MTPLAPSLRKALDAHLELPQRPWHSSSWLTAAVLVLVAAAALALWDWSNTHASLLAALGPVATDALVAHSHKGTLLCGATLGLLLALTAVTWKALRANEALRTLALQDPLTKLPNRLSFSLLLERNVNRSNPTSDCVGLFFIDLDRFKEVNDSLGHEGGDRLLQVVAKRLRSAVRSQDHVCRLSGDEFTVVLPGLEGADAAQHVAQRILESLQHPVSFRGQEVRVTASLGIALWPQDGLMAAQLLHKADVAAYAAKAAGKGQFVRYGAPHPLSSSNADAPKD